MVFLTCRAFLALGSVSLLAASLACFLFRARSSFLASLFLCFSSSIYQRNRFNFKELTKNLSEFLTHTLFRFKQMLQEKGSLEADLGANLLPPFLCLS